MHKSLKQADGKYHIKGSTYTMLVGKRSSVMHGNAYKTSGGLVKSDLLQNKNGRIVSRKKHVTAKREKRLQQHGYYSRKGVFGMIRGTPTGTRKRRSTKRK